MKYVLLLQISRRIKSTTFTVLNDLTEFFDFESEKNWMNWSMVKIKSCFFKHLLWLYVSFKKKKYSNPQFAGASRAPKVRGGQKPNFAPLFRKVKFYCIFMWQFFWILKVRGGRGPPGPRGYEAPDSLTLVVVIMTVGTEL